MVCTNGRYDEWYVVSVNGRRSRRIVRSPTYFRGKVSSVTILMALKPTLSSYAYGVSCAPKQSNANDIQR